VQNVLFIYTIRRVSPERTIFYSDLLYFYLLYGSLTREGNPDGGKIGYLLLKRKVEYSLPGYIDKELRAL